jgi:galactonate dehydratase
MTGQTLRSASWHQIAVSDKTCWIFLQLQQADGRVGQGEASLNGQEAAVMAAARQLSPLVRQAASDTPGALAAAIVPASLAEAAVVSAVDQALWDLYAQRHGRRVADMLGGGIERSSIAVYANINRRTAPRSPAGFAQSARDALAAGHVAFKLAPFDEVSPVLCHSGEGVAAMQAGLARIAAVRDVIGPQRRLMVDCHWRFDESTATALVHAAAEFGLHWIECPLPECDAHIAALVRLRSLANSHGTRLAGLEQGVRFEAFLPYCKAGAYDVMMPDVKYFGGLQQMQASAAQFAAYGVQFSPHNPTGPICHAASLQIAAAAASFDMLELQFDESPLFDQLVTGGFGPVVDGHCQLPDGPGLGVALDHSELQAHALHGAWTDRIFEPEGSS